MLFDGSTQYLDQTSPSSNLFIGTGDWTLYATFRKASSADFMLLETSTTGSLLNGVFFYLPVSAAQSHLIVGGAAGTDTYTLTGIPADTAVHNVTWANVSGTVRGYLDGVLKTTQAQTITPTVQTAVTHFIAKRSNNTQYFDGEIIELRMYNGKGLTEVEINASIQGSRNDKIVNGLRMRLLMNEGASGDVATANCIDVSGNGHFFTPQASPTYLANELRIR